MNKRWLSWALLFASLLSFSFFALSPTAAHEPQLQEASLVLYTHQGTSAVLKSADTIPKCAPVFKRSASPVIAQQTKYSKKSLVNAEPSFVSWEDDSVSHCGYTLIAVKRGDVIGVNHLRLSLLSSIPHPPTGEAI